MRQNRLQDKVALITGAASGIGAKIAEVFAQNGAQVILTDIDDHKGQEIAEKIKEQALYLHLDVSLESDWKTAMKEVLSRWGRLDILVNNAGITGLQSGYGAQDPENASLEDWRRIHAVNSDVVFLGCKHAIHAMKMCASGSIINISSRSGLIGIPGACAYAASKAAVRNHTKTVALYCCEQEYSIRCNSIHPAAILTPMWEPMLGIGAQREKNIQTISQDIPMKKMGDADDVACAALYLASDESKYVTGIELNIDGGILAGSAASPGKKAHSTPPSR